MSSRVNAVSIFAFKISDFALAYTVANCAAVVEKYCLFALQETHATKREESYNVAALTVNAGFGECWRKQNVQRASASKRHRDER